MNKQAVDQQEKKLWKETFNWLSLILSTEKSDLFYQTGLLRQGFVKLCTRLMKSVSNLCTYLLTVDKL